MKSNKKSINNIIPIIAVLSILSACSLYDIQETYTEKSSEQITSENESKQYTSESTTEYLPIMKEIFISPHGNKNGTGTIHNPFASIQEGKQFIRTINKDMDGNIICRLLPGTYFPEETLVFTNDDGGSNGYNIIYAGSKDEKSIINAGKYVQHWEVTENPAIYKTKIESEGFRQLYKNNERMEISTAGNQIYALGWFEDNSTNFAKDGFILKKTQELELLALAKNPVLRINMQNWWRDFYLPVDNVFEENDRIILSMKQPFFDFSTKINPSFAAVDLTNGFYIENAYSLLVNPGQWYYCPIESFLYYHTIPGEDFYSQRFMYPVNEKIIDVRGSHENDTVNNIGFEDLYFENSGWNEPTYTGFINLQAQEFFDGYGGKKFIPGAIEVRYAKNIFFNDNIFRNLGSVGISYLEGTSESEIKGNIFYDISDSAVVLGSPYHSRARNEQIVCRKITVQNNIIRKAGQEYKSAPGIQAYFVNNTDISHNDLSDLPYSGICIGWGWHDPEAKTAFANKVYGNRISDFLKKVKDGGGIYTLGQQPESSVFENYIQNDSQKMGALLYFDEGSAYFDVFKNVLLGPVYPWIYINTKHSRNINVIDNYTNSYIIRNYGTDITIENTIQIENQEIVENLTNTIENAGLQKKYQKLYETLNELLEEGQ